MSLVKTRICDSCKKSISDGAPYTVVTVHTHHVKSFDFCTLCRDHLLRRCA